MNQKRNQLLIFTLFFLSGCSSAISTAQPFPTEITRIEQVPPPTNTSMSCPPRLDIKLPVPDYPENYIGKVFQFPYPNDLRAQFDSSLMGDYERGTEYRLIFIINQGTGQQMFWFERKICRDTTGKTFYEIINTLALTLDLEQQEVVSSRSCEINGIFDPEIVAVGDRLPYSEKLKNIQQAWRANKQTKAIEEISVDGIECYRESGIRAP